MTKKEKDFLEFQLFQLVEDIEIEATEDALTRLFRIALTLHLDIGQHYKGTTDHTEEIIEQTELKLIALRNKLFCTN